jgi:hypothetical protein
MRSAFKVNFMSTFKTFCISALFLLTFTGCQNTKTIENQIALKPEIENSSNKTKQIKPENPAEKAVRLAEDFIKQNGYTDAPADKNNLSHETVEFYETIDELLEARHNTLEPKAYGIYYGGRLGDQKGWTVVFRRPQKKSEKSLESSQLLTGRAVTMNENFENLLVEHKDFILDKVDQKFQGQ